jgi:hypothetical protein
LTGVLVDHIVFERYGIPKSHNHADRAGIARAVTERWVAGGMMSLAGLIIAAILAWCLPRSPGNVLALVAVLAAVVWG